MIELICVMVILGVLATQALPRFNDLTDSAHNAVVAQTAAAFDTAAHLAFFACLIADYGGMDNLASFGSGNVDFNANCFPSSTSGNNNLNVNAARCMQLWRGLFLAAPSISTPASDVTAWRAQGGGSVCTYTYREDADDLRQFSYDAAGGIVAVTSNP